ELRLGDVRPGSPRVFPACPRTAPERIDSAMYRYRRAWCSALGLVWSMFVSVSVASAQRAPADIFMRGVPSGAATPAPLRLSLTDAIKRGLQNNLGGLVEAQRVRAAEG